MPLTDEETALQAIVTLHNLSSEQESALAAINVILSDGEPFADVLALFAHYNVLYFRGMLLPRVEVLWSPRLTLCAGICELSKDPSTGKFTRIRLKLSTPLLQFRPRLDTINTLLHEAIHAYFFITTSWRHSRGDDGTGHGVGFQLLADAINNHGGYEVTIYHTFHDEVENYRTHVWECNGPCARQPPYFGLVKRSMNRAPGEGDFWWTRHQAECGGSYTKIAEPAPTKKQLEAMTLKERAGRQKNKIDAWVAASAKKSGALDPDRSKNPTTVCKEDEIARPSKRQRRVEAVAAESAGSLQKSSPRAQREASVTLQEDALVECPICNLRIAESNINRHLDISHPP